MNAAKILPRNLARRAFSSYYNPTTPPPLFDLCVRKDFKGALNRTRTHPHEAKFKHPRGWTALHCCVEHVAPLEVVQAIYRANPESATAKDWNGLTPAEAAVDLETQEFLEQAMAGNVPTTTEDVSAEGLLAASNVELQKVIAHVNTLSSQAAALALASESMQTEIEALKEALRKLSK